MEHGENSHTVQLAAQDEQFAANILPTSAQMPDDAMIVKGIEWDKIRNSAITVDQLLAKMASTGFQATNLSNVIDIVQYIRSFSTVPDAGDPGKHDEIILGFTSNLISSGLRETIAWHVKSKHVSILVATAGGIEEDLMKCLAPTYVSGFVADDAALHEQHINRVGNLRLPNINYCKFEEWITPILASMLEEQEISQRGQDELKFLVQLENNEERASVDGKHMTVAQNSLANGKQLIWTPSSFIRRLGKEINNEDSICYWAYKNDIPVFCPALTDGSIGDMISNFMVRIRNRAPFPAAGDANPPSQGRFVFRPYPIPNGPRGLIIDIVADMDELNSRARNVQLHEKKMGAIILGAGLVKHHVMNACLNGGGADAAVYINTANEFDGSDAGASPSEAVSWGKLKAGAPSAKLVADATIVWPLVVANTWAKASHEEA